MNEKVSIIASGNFPTGVFEIRPATSDKNCSPAKKLLKREIGTKALFSKFIWKTAGVGRLFNFEF